MPPPRKSSVVVGQHSPGLVSKAIESEGGSVQGQNPSQTGEGVEVAFRGRVSGTLLARSILKALVIDSCGAPSGTVKRPEGDVQIDCEKPLGQIDFHQVMKQVQVKFDELPLESEGVAAIAEITYGRCLKKVVDLNPSVVLNFPSCLCGGGERFDLIVAGVLLVSIRIEGNSVARVFTKSIDALLGRMCSTAFVDSVLPSRWKDLESTEIQNLGDLLEDVQISINDYWEGSPQNDRSKAYAAFLMSAVGSDLRKYFSKHAHSSGGAYRSGTKVAEHALSTIEDWVGICERLTTVDWGSTWNQKYIDSALVRLKERLSTVVSIRTLFDEISERLDPLDMRALRGDSLWDVFESIDLFDVSQSIETKWQSAVATFYRRLEPIEHRCANSLRDFFSRNANLSPQAILAQFMQVRQLMKRPVVSKELVNERDGLLAKLSERLQTVRVEFEHRFHGGEKEQTLEEEDRRCQAGRHLPAVVNRIIWLRQIRGRIEQMTFMTKAMLADLGNASDFESQCETLLNELEEVEQETFKNWTFDVSDNARRLTLDSSATLLELDAQGKVEVNYSERLVQLLREVRVFAAMGFRVPPEIQQMAVQGQKFYQSGVALKQVATTYNGMQEDIIESTRAMLYDSAISFEHVITASGDRKLTWKNVADTNRFIDKLRNAAGLLSGDNRRLHRLHTEVRSLVLELFKIDLLRTKDRWMAKVRLIREKMAQSRFTNMGAWMRHWDMQIYKALEHQYQQGLESLHESVNEIKADVVYDSTSGKAVLRPPMETLRVQFYQRIKDFLTFPNRFQGVGNSEFFQLMPGHNERGILAVMQHASLLFKKIEKEVKKFAPMLVIGQCGQRGNPTLEEIVAAALTEVQHWEQNIRLLKQKGKDIAGVDLFVKIDCFTLCTAPIKQTVEEHLAKLADVLNSTIRKSAAQHLEKITQFLDKASEALDGKLTKLDEIGKANMLHAELMEQRPSIEVEFHHFFNKNKLLQSMTNSPGVEYQQVKSRWDGFVNRLDSHEKEMEEQLAKMKGAVDESVKSWQKNLERFNAQWHELKPKDVNASGNASKFVAERREQFEVLKTQGEEVRKQCVFFHMDEPNLQIIEDLESDIGVFAAMWATWSEFQADLTGLKDEPWITFRSKLFRMEDFVKLWQDKMRESTQASNNITVHIRILLDEWARATPIFKFVRGDGFTPSHWNELFRLLQIRDATQDTITFGMILDRYEIVLRLEKDLKNLHARAQGEAQIREALDDVRAWGSEAKFSLVPHPDRKGVVLITEWKELLTSVNDNQALLFSMKDSPFFSVFANDATKWEQRLAALDDYLHTMNSIQRKWVYLEPIFARGALPNEQERFMRVDKEYLMIMKGVETDSKVLSLASHAEYKDKLRNILEQLERCQKALNEFLEQKRDRLPRFYFISDDDLLEILGQSKNPVVIQSHLKKLFMGIHSVKFDNNKRNILAIQSLDGEHVALKNPVQITDEVEEWLDALDKAMKSTLQAHLLECLEKLDVGLYASQILCASEQVHFTKKTEEAMRGSAQGEMKKHRANLQAQLRELTAFSASNTDAVMELKLKALIMDLIHNIEVVDMLIANNVDKETDWLWRKQLRFYIGKDGLCTIRMVDASFKYSYEYQGNAPKLVHTPLTDRCYLTLTQGMQLGYGGNPYGPAGTGKTESVKALGNAMGRQVLVFNCDEGIDFKSMGRIFTGLVKCGAWGCFDEFNRLKVDQLSAVSQMIQVIQEALKNGEDNCNLLGRRINVDANAGIFVTLNPAGKGYGGRSKLPDNLKQLFRSVAMSAPDNELIAETILYSEGFEHAKELAKKMVEIFRLSKQLLSAQQHYDWGLRAMKAVLRLGGVLVHQYLKERISSGATPSSQQVLATESEIIIKSLRVNTLSKLTFDDAILFNNLISDVFPGIDIREIQYEELRPAIVESIKELKLQLIETQVLKILQLYEALQQRMGVVLVGPSGSGKSTLLKILRKALQRLNVTVPMYVMNPKAMPRHQLLGYMDMDTREWFDGVLTEAAKKVVREENTVRSWIFCDGDIDPEWVESLNSVLDDNKLLTMPNGVRIQFGGNVNFVFETHSLEYASPATVSRMGMIFLSEEDVDPRTAVATWLDDQPAEIRPQLGKWIQDYFYQAIDALLATKALIVDTTKTGLVMSGLSQLQGCTTKAQFAQGIIYGLGSYLIESQRIDYAKDVLYMVGERAPDPKNPLDFMYDVNRAGYRSFQFEPSMDLTVDDLRRTPMVNTVDCQRNTGIMQAWTRVGSDAQGKGGFRPFILVGPEGCGKTMLLTNLFANIPNSKVAVVNCSAQTVASHVIQKLKQMCQVFNTNQGRVLRPKEADRLILLLKDLNLPKPDRYGTVQLHSFLQQLVLYQGFYDSDLEWVTVERLQIVGSMNPPGSMGRFPVAPRFIAIVSVLTISYPTKEALQTIYSDFFNIMLQGSAVSGIAGKSAADIARAMTTVYETVIKRYTVDDASHYIFNPRDLTNWALNVCNYSGAEMSEVLAYEGRRIFMDRLVRPDDRTKFEKYLRDALAALNYSPPQEDKDGSNARCFVSWLDAAPAGKRKLTGAKQEDLKKTCETALMQYCRENADLNIQLIPEVLSWISRVDRVLSQENGNLLMVGRTGVCSPEMVRLVAFHSRMEVVSLNMTRDYNIKAFNLELKVALQRAGVEGLPTVLLLEDHNFFSSQPLEMINSLLSSGDVPGLFGPEEIDALLGPLKEEALGEGLSVYGYFVTRVRKFLHVCVVMDPTNAEYQIRCRSNPALFTRCTVCWLGSWQSDSLKLVPRLMLRDVFRILDQRDDKKDFSLTTELVNIHKHAGERFSPHHFKTLCDTYSRIFQQKNSATGESLNRLKQGLAKLAEAQENVDTISKEVTEKKALMEVKQKEADEALVQIQQKMEEAGDQKKNIQKIQKDIDGEQKVIEEKKSVIEGGLANIQPTLDAARAAVGSISSSHLSELKSLKSPPPAVQDVLEGVLVLLGSGGDTTWAAIRKFLAGDGVRSILTFDVKSMSVNVRDAVEKLIKTKENSFKPEVISRASQAAAPMAAWLKATVDYSKVLDTIQPMTDELSKYEANLNKGKERKQKYEEKLAKVEKKVDELKKNFGQKTKEAERLKDKLEQAETLLKNANDLLGKLAGEKTRWGEQVKVIQRDVQLMPRRSLAASAFITYLGNEPEDVRRTVLAGWLERLKLDEFNFFTFLRTESTLLQYKAQGLPGDELSMDNAVSILEQVRTPIIVDPASQAVEWLRNNLKERNVPVDVCNISDERLVSALELAIRFGKTFIITDVDKIEPFLYPLLRKELKSEGTKRVIQIGDRRSIDYADGFQLFLVTRSTDLRISPDATSYLTEVSFTITQSGLEGQLLGVTIQYEQPELEQQKIEILKKEEALKLQLATLEESLLRDLASSQGSLLENTTLIESLNQIKTQASEIEEALSTSKTLQVQLDEKRNVYRSFAATGSTIFFLIKNLSALSHMYQFSLGMFLDIIDRTLKAHSGTQMGASPKIEELTKTLIRRVVESVSRALLKEHRVTFGIHLARSLNASALTEAEWSFFVDRAVVSDQKRGEARIPSWVLPDSRSSFQLFAALFPELMTKINLQESDVWYQWMGSSTPEVEYPLFLGKISAFQRLLVIKALRADRLIAAMNLFACQTLQVQALTDNSSLQSLVQLTRSTEPILLITTAGADPSQDLQQIAYQTVGREKLHQIAMGGGQTDEALRLLRQASQDGHWLVLKNLHLVIPWVSVLQKELNIIKPHDNFRLWLTSEAHDEFPQILLSNSLKVTFEAPPGVKQNLVRTFNNWSEKQFQSRTPVQTQLLFIAAWLHAIVQERRSYIPQGWAKFYEFSAADLKSATDIIVQQTQNNTIDWRSIHGLLENAIYGGRMETEYDVRILRTYLNRYLNPEMLSTARKQQSLYFKVATPATGKHRDFETLIQSLADNDVPALFSLPPNADRVVQSTNVAAVVNDLQRMQETKSLNAMTREEWSNHLTPLLNTWLELTQPHSALLSHSTPQSRRDAKPIEGFVDAEVASSIALLRRVNNCTTDLRRVIEGTLLLSEARRTESNALIAGEVPLAWDGVFCGPERIVPWFTSLVGKAVAIQEWQALSNSSMLLKSKVNLSSLLRPQTFLNALRQETSHLTREPLVSLKLVSKIGSPPTGAALPVCLTGLLLQGAVIDETSVLSEIQAADAAAFFQMPDVYIGWVLNANPLPTDVAIPAYVNASKEVLLTELTLPAPTAGEVERFILAGISIVLE
ncbi:dynein heavy chain, putative [Bodo saltans]|uniref:Cytoplasmic dynein 2 heavy chain 1 n=1 Tax=Bodo saltans TaxID=75058 RepID=A0A0S4JCL7_BODSA|nr:dynein heavy chain, putative [Bodo saltans]|eukprot:CUG87914.1 dynein heavy chain, putative [Bodo saltans]